MKKQRVELWALFVMATAIVLAAQILLVSESEAQTFDARSVKSKPTLAPQGKETLSVAKFLGQVAQGNDAYKAAELNRKGAQDYSDESSLVLAPTLFANARIDSEGKPSPFPISSFNYASVDSNAYSAGVSKLFATGIKTSFSYAVSSTDYVGMAGAQKYFEARPQIEASIPLWKNFWGRETIGGVNAGRLDAMAKAQSQDAIAKGVLADAEAAYWRLALAREALKVSQDSLFRAQAMFDWSKRRVNLALSDKSEGLQSNAELKARELDLKIAADEERSARLQFNSARGLNSDKVSESLDVMNAALIAKWETPKRTQSRPDIEAARLQAEAAEARAQAAGERSKPTLELYGLYAFNSPHRNAQSEAIDDSWKRDRPSTQYGVRFSIPLDISDTNRAQEGWAAEANASRYLASRKLFEQERDWNDVVARFELAKEKIRLYEELENSQREKLEYERTRQKSGRSTVAQVILFESHYQQTQFARLRALAEVLNLNAQMKLYGVAYAPVL